MQFKIHNILNKSYVKI